MSDAMIQSYPDLVDAIWGIVRELRNNASDPSTSGRSKRSQRRSG
jgi:hypothetical protein